MKENRLDRIEKGLEEFFRIVMEDRKTNAEFRAAEAAVNAEFRAAEAAANAKFRAAEAAANAELRASIAELRESQKKTDEQFRKTDEQIRSFHEKFMEEIRELKESQKKTDEQLRKTDEKLRDTAKKLDDTGELLGKLGIIDGKVAEDLFYRNVRHVFAGKDMPFSSVKRNVKKKGISGEYDIVAVGENRILVIEVKKKMEEHLINDFLERKLPRFRQIFPEYRDFPIIGGVGALVMQDAVSRYAEKKGLYVLTQNGEGGAMLVNRQNFTAKEF